VLAELAAVLADVGRAVRRTVGAGPLSTDAVVVDARGGDEVFGVDARAEQVLIDTLQALAGEQWPGTLVMEGFDDPIVIGAAGGPWRYIADPVDGSRPWLAGKRSAWTLLGAGREATSLAELEVGACVELPTIRAAVALVAYAVRRTGSVTAVDDPMAGVMAVAAPLMPSTRTDVERGYVTVARFAPGDKAAIGAWEDAVLAGLETYEDPYLCSGGQLMEVATGRELAVLDPRPLLGSVFAAHPYDLAAWVVAAEAGVVVEALPPGPLGYPLDTSTPCAWAAYANESIASLLRARVRAHL
jgi:fructose-1,6-bisphosphatase/inositol monophosphatase family enzyme